MATIRRLSDGKGDAGALTQAIKYSEKGKEIVGNRVVKNDNIYYLVIFMITGITPNPSIPSTNAFGTAFLVMLCAIAFLRS